MLDQVKRLNMRTPKNTGYCLVSEQTVDRKANAYDAIRKKLTQIKDLKNINKKKRQESLLSLKKTKFKKKLQFIDPPTKKVKMTQIPIVEYFRENK